MKLKRLMLLLLAVQMLPVHANPKQVQVGDCIHLLTNLTDNNSLPTVLSRTQKSLAKAIEEEPVPENIDISQARKQNRWSRVQGPKAFDYFLPNGVGFAKTPDPNTESPYMVMRKAPKASGMLRLDMDFKGEPAGTKIFFSTPTPNTKTDIDGTYLIGPRFKAVAIHLHGGGTPMSVAANASTKALYFAKKGIPMIALDLPGHGNGPDYVFESDKEIAYWIMDVLDKLVHPDVDIHMAGHSWGGGFTTKIWLESDDPRFARIKSFHAESPPVDASLGSGVEAKFQIEAEINRSIDQWAHKAAPADVEFLKNVVKFRKMSPRAEWQTIKTDIFNQTPVPTEEEVARRAPLHTIVGKYDALVYVGREKQYDTFFSNASEKYTLLDKGKTFKGSDIAQGHNIFDLENEAGDLVAYRHAIDLVSKVSKVELQDIDPELGDIENGDEVIQLINKIFLNYSNSFAFREYLMNHSEYITVVRPKKLELVKRTDQLTSFVDKYQNTLQTQTNLKGPALERELKAYAAKYNVKGGFKGADKELSVNLTADRRQELNRYIKEQDAAEKAFKESYTNEAIDQKRADFVTQVAEQSGERRLEDIRRYVQLENAKKAIQSLTKRLGKTQEASELEIIKDEIQTAYKDINLSSIAEVDQEMKSLKESEEEMMAALFKKQQEKKGIQSMDEIPSSAIKPHKKQWISQFESQVIAYKNIEKEHRSQFGMALSKHLNDFDAPAGVENVKDAKWELSVNLTPERIEELKLYIAGYEDFKSAASKRLDQGIQTELDRLQRPSRIESVQDAEIELTYLNQIRENEYVPTRGTHKDEIARLVQEMKRLKTLLDTEAPHSYMNRYKKLEAQRESLLTQRSKLVRMTEALINKSRPTPRMQDKAIEVEALTQALDNANHLLAGKIQKFLIELYQSEGKITKEALDNLPETFPEESKKFKLFLDKANAAVSENQRLVLEEAMSGQFANPKIQEAFIKLVGEEFLTTGKFAQDSIEGTLFAVNRDKDIIEALITETQKKYNEALYRYVKFFPNPANQDEGLYTDIYKINIAKVLDQSLAELINEIQTSPRGSEILEALKNTLFSWETMWKRTRLEDNLSKSQYYEANDPVL